MIGPGVQKTLTNTRQALFEISSSLPPRARVCALHLAQVNENGIETGAYNIETRSAHTTTVVLCERAPGVLFKKNLKERAYKSSRAPESRH